MNREDGLRKLKPNAVPTLFWTHSFADTNKSEKVLFSCVINII